MKKDYLKIFISAVLISVIGVFIIDYFSHLLFSEPMETLGYFIAKAVAYFIFSLIFLAIFNLDKNKLVKIIAAGIVVASLWGMYYNIFPLIFEYYPFGIALNGLTFLGTGIFWTGLAFGLVHVLAFIVGYYASEFILKKFK